MRTAAAAAISGQDAQGAKFAEKQIRDFLTRYGNRFSQEEITALYIRARANSADAEADSGLQEIIRFQQDQNLVMMLRFLETPAAEALTFEACKAKNLTIPKFAAAVAASRWPERFLAAGQGKLTRDEYANLLTLIATKRSRLRDKVLKEISEKELDEAQARLRKPLATPGRHISPAIPVFLEELTVRRTAGVSRLEQNPNQPAYAGRSPFG